MQKKSSLPLSAAIAVLAMGITTGSQAQTVSCGDVITTPTTLDSDLTCTIADEFSVAIAIEGPSGSLTMGDYSLTCSTNEFGTGIILLGSGARLTGGSVISCGDAVTLGGNGNHYVTGVTITDFGDDAVYVESDSNVVSNMHIVGDGTDSDEGIDIQGNNNLVNSNIIEFAGDEGIEVGGDYNTVTSNEVYYSDNDGIEIDGIFAHVTNNITAYNGSSGIEIDSDNGTISLNNVSDNEEGGINLDQGDSNSISNNNVVNNGTNGIFILDDEPTNNTISGNVSQGQTFDLFDPLDPDCTDSNTWQNNTFTTSDPSCLD
ncbi:right-handed parallel beta-helix repeat-containing protein [Microbulbifer sp. VAAF005]|uniref:right-handed parallel beta-helix repeat-containing protein n=1 Tax=Microbulbifer sp. VAAF005 TaxID=3034230 RepID=UPI0024AE791E|nr:right-handed parallel beta-helix repeat-containing protein [Microbulbifer sp. VAAF005]WHI47718.1 right-handed parallel beta-helix repeat-containing protein [Microbulbifer sp. VAAF005]